MIAEILATGDEIRSGALVDSNSAHISQRLEEEGVAVVRHQAVGDDVQGIAEVLLEIARRADIGVVTGGLGPTVDDLTAEAAALAADVPLVEDPEALEAIAAFFRHRNRPMSRSNAKQALLPRGAERLDNPVGTAPGFSIRIGRCIFFFLPGVPAEMRRMLDDQVLPRIATLRGAARTFYRIRTLSCFGLPESVTGERLDGMAERFPEIRLGLRAKFPEIQVKLYGAGPDEQRIDRSLESAARWAAERLGDAVFSPSGRSMEDVVGRLLLERGATLAVAESCTGGLVAHRLTDVPGSSGYFRLSAVTYSNAAKVRVLGVSEDTLARFGAVHEQTALEMARGVRELAGATYAVATSGIAGPDGGSPDKPVGTVCIGLAGPRGVSGQRLFFPFADRRMNKAVFAMAALDVLRRELAKG